MRRQAAVVVYVLALVAVVVGVDILFFRHHFWERLIGHPVVDAAGVVVSASTAAGRGPSEVARVRARMRPAPPGGARCRKRQQDVAR